ncbi:MAG: response regulator, partial [Gammaproteobacteria bacterium]|nr:response regulator [Gammaproteobacteria bacterium]
MSNPILLVEDNPDDQLLTLRAFKKSKMANEVLVADDGEEAIDYFFRRGKFTDRPVEEIPELVLLDLKLPKVDGL